MREQIREITRWCLRTVFTLFKVRCSIAFKENKVPHKAVYVSNHVSFLDPLMLFAFLPGNPLFALNGHLYRNRWIRLIMWSADIMPFNPIEPSDLKELISIVNKGRCCVIFAEGRMTSNGRMMKIYEAPDQQDRAAELLVNKRNDPFGIVFDCGKTGITLRVSVQNRKNYTIRG